MIGWLGVLCTMACLMAQTPVHRAVLQMIAVEDSNGKPHLGMQAREEPYQPGGRLAGEIYVTERRDARDEHGLIVNGIGFYPWLEGSKVHVRVFELVPRAGHANKFWADSVGDIKAHLTSIYLGDYQLAPGERREIAQMKAFGLSPLWLVRK